VTDETPAEAPAQPLLRVVRGEPSPEELAALVAVLAARGGADEQAAEPAQSAWSRPRHGERGYLPVGPLAWRESGFEPGVRTRADW
jgi:hypothetical protein